MSYMQEYDVFANLWKGVRLLTCLPTLPTANRNLYSSRLSSKEWLISAGQQFPLTEQPVLLCFSWSRLLLRSETSSLYISLSSILVDEWPGYGKAVTDGSPVTRRLPWLGSFNSDLWLHNSYEYHTSFQISFHSSHAVIQMFHWIVID